MNACFFIWTLIFALEISNTNFSLNLHFPIEMLQTFFKLNILFNSFRWCTALLLSSYSWLTPISKMSCRRRRWRWAWWPQCTKWPRRWGRGRCPPYYGSLVPASVKLSSRANFQENVHHAHHPHIRAVNKMPNLNVAFPWNLKHPMMPYQSAV